MANPPTIRIFFSSPGDVKMERETARRIVQRLQGELGERAVLEPYFWEHEVMRATRDYQQNIPAMDGFDVVVCILWTRLGSPLDPQRYRRPDGGSFESGTEYEFFTAMEAHRQRGVPDVFVFKNETDPRAPSRPQEELEAFTREVGRLNQFFARYFKRDVYYEVAITKYSRLNEFEERLTQGLRDHLKKHLPPPPARARPVATYQGRAYLGLLAFEFSDAPVFFGRTAQVGEVIRAFQAQELDARASEEGARRFVLVLGASGSGKSSLARAGVLPMLVQPGVVEGAQVWRHAIVKPGAAGGDPFLSLATALLAAEALPELGSDGTQAAALAGLLRRQPGGGGLLLRQALSQAGAAARAVEEQSLRDRLRQYESARRVEDAAEMRERLERLAPAAVRLALLVDQLEELFTSDQTAESRAAFVECLDAIARSGRVFVLATLRSDFYPSCLAHPQLVELMRASGSYALPAPGGAELSQMIREPAVAAGLVLEENPTSGEKLYDLLRDAALRDPSALPLLGYTLEQLHERRTPEGVLTIAAYRELGGLEGAIGRRADQVFDLLPAEARDAFDAVWRQLVTLGEGGAPVRRRVDESALTAHAGAPALLKALVDARLLTADTGTHGTRTYSVAHEALLAHWKRVAEWIEGNREFLSERKRLDERLKEWEARKRHKGCLIPGGPALEKAEELLAQHAAVLSPQEVEYIEKSSARALALERRERLLVYAWRGLALLALLVGAYAWHERGTALDQKSKAEENARQAHASQARAAYLIGIEQLKAGQTRAGLAHLEQALQIDPEHTGARDRLYSYLLYGLPRPITLHSSVAPEDSRQHFSTGQHDGLQRMACLDARGAPEVFDLDTRCVLPGDWSVEANQEFVLLNRTGTQLLGRRGRDCRLWDVDSGRAGPSLQLDENCNELACSDDGTLLVEGISTFEEGGPQGRVRVWDVASRRVLHEWRQYGYIRRIELDSARGRLAAAGGETVFFDLVEGVERGCRSESGWDALDVRFAEEDDVAVVEELGADGYRFAFLDARTGSAWTGAREIRTPKAFDFAVSRGGVALAVAPFADQVVIQYRDDPAQDRTFKLPAYATGVRFSPDDTQLLCAGSDGAVRIFDIGSGEPVFAPIQHDGRLDELLLSWDSRFLITSTTNTRRASVWDLAVGRGLPLPLVQPGTPYACGFDAAGSTLWTSGSQEGIQAWDARTLERKGKPASAPGIAGAVWDGACSRAMVALPDRSIQAVDLAKGGPVGTPFQPPAGNLDWSQSGDGTRIGILSGSVVTFLDTATGAPIGKPWTLPGAPRTVRMCGDGRRAAAVVAGGAKVLLHDCGSGADLELDTAGSDCSLLRFSRDDHWLAAAESATGTRTSWVLLWNLREPGAPPKRLAHNDDVHDLRFSPDGRWLATGTLGQIVQVWEAQTGSVASNPIFETGSVVRYLMFSPDNSRLVVIYGDNAVRLYDWHESCMVSEPFHLQGELVDLCFSPDGKRLCTLCAGSSPTASGIATVWELAPPAGLRLDLAALTESSTALHVSDLGVQEPCDPSAGLKRLRHADPGSWFLAPPLERSISPAFDVPARRWVTEGNTTDMDAFMALPDVSMVRAVLCYLRQTQWNDLDSRLARAKPDEAGRPEAERMLADLERAIAALSLSAERGARNDAMTSFWLARQRAAAEKYGEARLFVENALRLAPDDREVLDFACGLYEKLEDCEAEKRCLQRALLLEPGAAGYRLRLVLNRWRCGEREAARAESAALVGEPSITGNDRGFLMACLGRYEEALAAWTAAAAEQRAANEGKYTVPALMILATAAELAGQDELALRYCEAMFTLEPRTANPAIVDGVTPYPELREGLRRVLEATLARHPELRKQ